MQGVRLGTGTLAFRIYAAVKVRTIEAMPLRISGFGLMQHRSSHRCLGAGHRPQHQDPLSGPWREGELAISVPFQA